MEIRNTGKVIKDPEIIGDKVVYGVNINCESYTVESEGRQAVKDYIFVRDGQSIEIEGNVRDNCIEVRKARIDI